jgi:hypothetical protein
MEVIMKQWQYTTCVILGVACVALSAVIIYTSQSNITLQNTIQARQQQLNNSVLGEQTQQVANNILQDMAATATGNEKMRSLLAKYGYTVPAASAPEQTPAKKEEK